jgi:hypothetical protein
MTWMTVLGPALGLAAAVLTLALARDALRREGVPTLRYGPRTVGGRGLRWAWVVLLSVGFVAGVEGVTITSRERARVVAPEVEGRPPAPSRTTIRVPFYEREHRVEPSAGEVRSGSGNGVVMASVVEERLELPWPLLLAAGLYWLLVVRWPAGEARP